MTGKMGLHGEEWTCDLGARVIPAEGVFFKVWAPMADFVSVRIISDREFESRLNKDGEGYFSGIVEEASAGDRYVYVLDHKDRRPDPASRSQPDGVHGPSQVIDPSGFFWTDDGWQGTATEDLIIYELHAGAFTPEGTFDAIIPRLGYLSGLGITAIELMPVAQFPGSRNWGYDGAYPFAPQNTYGGPQGLKKLINAAHGKGLSVILDVVYNHLGPEGNYLHRYGPYFTDRYRTPWGDAVNFDGPFSDGVRRFFICNALYWITEYHIDALRLDAVHGIFDSSARHFLKELREAVRTLTAGMGRHVHVMAESDLNDVRIIGPPDMGGYDFDAQWNDDFHHALHALLTGEHHGYYGDFGSVEHLATAFREGFVYSGQYSRFRKRRHGTSSKDSPAGRFIVFSQSHDQVGNRMSGDRLSRTQSPEKLKLAAGTVLLSPYVPLLFMGEEYGEVAPFQYFVSHSDDALVQAVRKGRREEFASFGWDKDLPDPQAESTFFDSKLNIGLHQEGWHRMLFQFYRELLRLRKEIAALRHLDKKTLEVSCTEGRKVLQVRRWFGDEQVFCVYNFGERLAGRECALPGGRWVMLIESSDEAWGGQGGLAAKRIESSGTGTAISLQPFSFVLYRMQGKGA